MSSRGEGGDPRSGRMMEENGFESLGDLLRHSPLKGDNPQARIALIWEEVVGSEVARNAHPRFLRQGRLVVATRSSVWAQSLQFMGDEVKRRLNDALGEELVGDIRFRPAGWDPGGGVAGPRHLDGSVGGSGGDESNTQGYEDRARDGERLSPEKRPLTAEEEKAVEEVRRAAVDPELGEKIAAAMRATLRRGKGGGC